MVGSWRFQSDLMGFVWRCLGVGGDCGWILGGSWWILVDLEAVLGGSWWILKWILVDLDDTWITYYARLKTQKIIKIIRFMFMFERSILVDLGGSRWFLKWS